jgi:hypothetical protein
MNNLTVRGSRPNLISSNIALSGSAQTRLGRWFNTAAFAQPAAFTFGSEPRTDPVLRAAEINNFDFTVVKDTEIRERFRLQFRTEFFNLFNRVQFADPGTSFGSPQFGIVTSAMNLPGLVQLGLRLSF